MKKAQLQPSSPELNHHRKKALKLINQLTKTQKLKKSQQLQYKVRTLHQVNKQIQASIRRNALNAQVFASDQLIIYIRYYFMQNISKCACLTFFRLILVSQQVAQKYLSHNIPIYISRLMQRQESKSKSMNHQDQLYQCLRLVQQWCQKFPSTFPKLLLTTLISFAQLPIIQGFQQKKKDHISLHLKQLAVDILVAFSSKSTKMMAFSGGFALLAGVMLDQALIDKADQVVYRFIYFYNQSKNRDYIKDYINLQRMFSVFTDLDNTFLQDSSKSRGNMQNSTKFQKQLQLAKRGIISLIKSWTGIIYLGHEQTVLKSFLQALKQIPKKQDSQVRKVIFSIIQQILSIGDNLIGTETSIACENEFRVANLVNCYVISLIQLLLQNNLFKILIELSGVEESNIAQPAQKLLKKLSTYIFNFLPDSSKYIDFLISAATKTDSTSLILKSSSSFIMNKIGNYIYDKSSQIKNSELNAYQTLFNLNSIYVPLGRLNINEIARTLNTLTCREKQNQRRQLIQMNPIPREHKDDVSKWDWDVIQELFVFPERQKELNSKLDSHQKHKQGKILKYLLRFYSHTRGTFSQLKWTKQSFQYLRVGKLFIRNAITIPQLLPLVKNPPESQFQCTVSFMGELEKLLETTLINFSKSRNNFYPPFFKLLERHLVLWIGLFSQNKVGYQVLLCDNNFFELLYQFISRPQCSVVIFSLMLYLDFYRQNMSKKISRSNQPELKSIIIGPKALLKKCIKQGSKKLQILSLEIIKLLFKAQLPGFQSQGVKLLIFLLTFQDQDIITQCIQTISYLLQEKSIIEVFLACLMEEQAKQYGYFQKIIVKMQKSNRIFIRLISIQIGFKFITAKRPNWLEKQYSTKWINVEIDQNYCLVLENLLNQTLNFVRKKQNEYKIQNCKTIYELGFLYKLPWLIYINDQQIPGHVKMSKNKFTIYYCFQDPNNYSGFFNYQDKSIKVALAIGSQFVDQTLTCSTAKVTKQVFLQNLEQKNQGGQTFLCAYESGITIYLKQKVQQMQIIMQQSESQTHVILAFEIKKIVIDIKIYFCQHNQSLPLHLIQQLTKTQSGLQFLTEKKFLSHIEQVLNSPSSSLLQLRSSIWSLGYYGSTSLGITQLIEKGIADQIVTMSFQCGVLSLRGTCRYVLNMFCHSEIGRNFIVLKGFVLNKKTLTCFPKNFKRFYQIQNTNYKHFSLNQQYWRLFEDNMRPMNQNETKLFNLISQLINALSYKQSITSIKEMMKNSIKVIHSMDVLQNVINLLSFYKFRNDARKNIYMIFQEFFKSPDFNSSVQNKIKYVTSQDIQSVPLQVQQ